jgi:RNA polymerase sigma-32 factor
MAERLDRRDTSLDATAYREGTATLLDTLGDDRVDQEAATADAQRDAKVRAIVAEVWRVLDERERMIVQRRLFTNGDDSTLADIGRTLGISRERVRQLEARVKSKLRHALRPVAMVA